MSIRLHILVTDSQHARLVQEANRTGVSVTELVRRAIDNLFPPDARPHIGGFEVRVGVRRRAEAAVAARRPGIKLIG